MPEEAAPGRGQPQGPGPGRPAGPPPPEGPGGADAAGRAGAGPGGSRRAAEAARPAGRAGAGLAIRWGAFPSPFGEALAMTATGERLCALAFTAERGRPAALRSLAAQWPAAAFLEDSAAVAPLAAAALGGEGGETALDLIGTAFERAVWEALRAVPPGRVTTYGALARAIGRPGAARAVGRAVGRNPLAWLVPCHRVLPAAGGPGGYRWGIGIKRAMLAQEGALSDTAVAGDAAPGAAEGLAEL